MVGKNKGLVDWIILVVIAVIAVAIFAPVIIENPKPPSEQDLEFKPHND